MARNAALAAAGTEYSLILDADEWIVSASGIRDWAATAGHMMAGAARVTSPTCSDGHKIDTSIVQIRLLPKGCTYVGAIHEMPAGYAGWEVAADLAIGHDGYEPEHVLRKRGRNLSLLETQLARQPDDAYLRFQIGREYQIRQEWHRAAEQYALARLGAARGTRWHPELIARSLYVLSKLGRQPEAIELAQLELRSGTDAAEALSAIGNLCLDAAVSRPQAAGHWIALARTCWQTCLRLGEDQRRYDTTEGVGSYLAAHNLAQLSAAAGDTREALRWSQLEAGLRAGTQA